MNKAFEKYDFPQSSPKKILIPRVTQEEEDTNSQVAFQLKLVFGEHDSKDNMEAKEV